MAQKSKKKKKIEEEEEKKGEEREGEEKGKNVQKIRKLNQRTSADICDYRACA